MRLKLGFMREKLGLEDKYRNDLGKCWIFNEDLNFKSLDSSQKSLFML